MKKHKGQKAIGRIDQPINEDVDKHKASFKKLCELNSHLLLQWLMELTEAERTLALWLIKRNIGTIKLLDKTAGTFIGGFLKSINKTLLYLDNLLGVKQREIGEQDPNLTWNEKGFVYNNEYYRNLDETNYLKFELFEHIAPEKRDHVDNVVRMFYRKAFLNWGRATEFGEPISKKYIHERMELLKKWLSNPEGNPPAP